MEYTKQTDKETMSETKSKAKQTASEVQELASSVADEAKHQAKEGINQVKQEARSTIAIQKEEAASELHGVAEALRMTGSQLRDQEQNMFAEYSNKVAEKVDNVSTYLEEHELDEVIRDAENFARRQPEIFLGGAFTLGLLASRFWKSSASSQEGVYQPPARRPESAMTNYPTTPTRSYTRERENLPYTSDKNENW